MILFEPTQIYKDAFLREKRFSTKEDAERFLETGNPNLAIPESSPAFEAAPFAVRYIFNK